MDNSPIIQERALAVDPTALWSALTDPGLMTRWFFKEIRTFEARPGFETRFTVAVDDTEYVHHWNVLEAVEHERLVYRWRYDGIDGDSTVRWELTSSDGSLTTLRLTHEGHESFPQNNPVFSRAAAVSGWSYFLDRLSAHLEGPHIHHAIDYIELSVTDMDAAMAFYRSAFGWEFTPYGPGYAGIQGATKEMGGITHVDEVSTGGPLIVLYSRTLNETLNAVRGAGATITKEIFSFPGGERFEFLDPSGNALAVWRET